MQNFADPSNDGNTRDVVASKLGIYKVIYILLIIFVNLYILFVRLNTIKINRRIIWQNRFIIYGRIKTQTWKN